MEAPAWDTADLEPDAALGLAVLVEEELARYFTVILPARIDAHFRGNGYEMLWHMLDAHDRNDLARPPGPPPSRRALAMAEGVRDACPPTISDEIVFQGGGVLFGRFSGVTQTTGTAVRSSKGVELFPIAMLRSGITSLAALRAEIALTIFHEYIHYFESFLLVREQPLSGRENRRAVERFDLAEARRRDRRYARRRLAKWCIVGAAAVAIAIAIVGGSRKSAHEPPPPPSAAEVAQRAQADRDFRETSRAQDLRLRGLVDAIVARDLGPAEAVALVGEQPALAFAPGRESPLVPTASLVANPALPDVPGPRADAVLTYLWTYDRANGWPRELGVAWMADGHPVRVAATIR